jgi:hypothetical protein
VGNVKYEFTPFDDKQLEAAVKRLAFIMANRMGWIPKELAKNKEKHQDLENGDKIDEQSNL